MTELMIVKDGDGSVGWVLEPSTHSPNAITMGTNVTYRQRNIMRWMAAIYKGFGLDLPLGEEMQIMNPQKASDYNTVVRAGVVLWNKHTNEDGEEIDRPCHETVQEAIDALLGVGVRLGKYANYSPSE